MKVKTQRAIEDIIDIADRLQSHKFQEAVDEKGLGFGIDGTQGEEYILHFEFPDDTVIDATLYSLRLFDQQGEGFSFHRLDQLLSDSSLSENTRDEIRNIRRLYFEYLNGHSKYVKLGFFEEGAHPTNGEILRVVIHGGYGHRKDYIKRKRYQTWTRDEIREAVLYQVFSGIIYNIISLIDDLKTVVKREIES